MWCSVWLLYSDQQLISMRVEGTGWIWKFLACKYIVIQDIETFILTENVGRGVQTSLTPSTIFREKNGLCLSDAFVIINNLDHYLLFLLLEHDKRERERERERFLVDSSWLTCTQVNPYLESQVASLMPFRKDVNWYPVRVHFTRCKHFYGVCSLIKGRGQLVPWVTFTCFQHCYWVYSHNLVKTMGSLPAPWHK